MRLLPILRSLKIRPYRSILAILALSSISFTWFRGDNLIEFADFYIPYDTTRNFNRYFSFWDPIVPFGQPNYRNTGGLIYPYFYHICHDIFRLSLVQTEMALFYMMFALSGLSTYYMLGAFGKSEASRLIAAALYMFSPFNLIVMWGKLTGRLIAYATFPFLLGVARKIGNEKLNRKSMMRWSVVLTLVSISLDPTYLLILSLPGIIYFIVSRGWQRAGGRRILGLALTWAGLNAFWILPVVYSLGTTYQSLGYLSLIGSSDIEAFRGNSVRLIDAVRQTGIWDLYTGYRGDPYYWWSWIVVNPLFISLGFLMAGIASLAIILAPRDKDTMFFALLAISGIILTTGSNPPIGDTYLRFLTYSGLLRLLRSPFTEFGIYVALGYSSLISVSLHKLSSFRFRS